MAHWLPEIFAEPVVDGGFRGDAVIPDNPDASKSVAGAVAEWDAEQENAVKAGLNGADTTTAPNGSSAPTKSKPARAV